MTSSPLSSREIFTEWFAGRLLILGAAALGFIATFMVLGHQIASLKSVLLPLVIFLPVYLVLISLNMVWVVKTVARFGTPAWAQRRGFDRRGRMLRILATLFGLAFGVIAALVYVHAVSK